MLSKQILGSNQFPVRPIVASLLKAMQQKPSPSAGVATDPDTEDFEFPKVLLYAFEFLTIKNPSVIRQTDKKRVELGLVLSRK